MGARGVHFALTSRQEQRLLDAEDDDDAMEMIEILEERWEDVCETDKAWDAIHRCLTDGTLTGTDYPLSLAVLGGGRLVTDPGYIVAYVSADQVREVAEALAQVDEPWLRTRYDALDTSDYDGPHGDKDFDYTWSYFTALRDFFTKATTHSRPIIFTVAQ